MWKGIGMAALERLDMDMALAAFRMFGDASMVLSLEQISNIEDKNLLAGHTMVLLERDTAQAQVRRRLYDVSRPSPKITMLSS